MLKCAFLRVSTARRRIISIHQAQIKSVLSPYITHNRPSEHRSDPTTRPITITLLSHAPERYGLSGFHPYFCSEHTKALVTAGPQTADHRTYCENIYLTGRHRQKWLCGNYQSDLLCTSNRTDSHCYQYGHLEEATPPRCWRATLQQLYTRE